MTNFETQMNSKVTRTKRKRRLVHSTNFGSWKADRQVVNEFTTKLLNLNPTWQEEAENEQVNF